MGDLLALLNEIKSSRNDMEFCEDFHQVELILNGINQYIHSLDKIVFDSGNEPYIIEVVARLLKYFRVQHYLNAHNKVEKRYEPQLRRITMYLLLNTDVSFRYDLMQDPRINQLLNSLPQLTKCLLMNCIWGLDLDRFFYEMLRYSPLWYSMQFIDQAIASLKYGKPQEVLTRIESMVCAIYFAICRTDVECKKEKRSEYVNQQRTLDRMCDYVGEMLRFVNTPDASKFQGWTKLRKHRYFGHLLKHMFSMTMACLDLYFRKPAIPVDPAMAIYQLMDDVHVHREAGIEYTQATLGWLLKINHFMLNTLETCIMHVSLECFVYWSEIVLYMEGQEAVSLQRVIGNFAYRLCEELNSHKHFRHSIVRHLTQFALRPKSLAERATSLNLGALMRRIDSVDSSDERLVYLNEFIHRGEQVLDNDECIATIDEHWELLTVEHLKLMIAFDRNTPMPDGEEPSDENTEPSDARILLREIILRAVSALPAVEYYQLLQHVIATEGKQFAWYGEQEQVPGVIQLVNRLQNLDREEVDRPLSDDAVRNLRQLIFQSPAMFFKLLVKSLYWVAPQSNHDKLVDGIMGIIVQYAKIGKCYMYEHLQKLLVTRFDVCNSSALIRFAERLYEANLFPPEEFMEDFLLSGLRNADEAMHLPALNALLKLMKRIWPAYCASNEPELSVKRQTVLREAVKRLALISHRLRYQYPPTHLAISPPESQLDRMMVVWMAIKQMLPTLDQLTGELPDKGLHGFLEELLETIDSFTSHYLRDRLQSDSKQPIPFLSPKYMSCLAEPPNGDNQDEAIVTYLVKHLAQCTREEIVNLAKIESFQSCLLTANVSELSERFAEHRTADWVLHCYINYVAGLVQAVLSAKIAQHSFAKQVCCQAVRSVAGLLAGFSTESTALVSETVTLLENVQFFVPKEELKPLISFTMDRPIERCQKPAPVRMDVCDEPDVVVVESIEESV